MYIYVYIYIYIYICVCIYIYQASPNLHLLCIPFYASFCENYAKHYFDAYHLKGLIDYEVVKLKWSPFFHKKCTFCPILDDALIF